MGFKASPMFKDLLVFNWKAVDASLELPCFYHDQKCVLDQKQPEKKKKRQGPSVYPSAYFLPCKYFKRSSEGQKVIHIRNTAIWKV